MSMVFLVLEFSWVISCIILLQNTSFPDTGFIFIWGQSLKCYYLLNNDVAMHLFVGNISNLVWFILFVNQVLASRESLVDSLEELESDDATLMSQVS
jgi:hypothetical protein